MLSTDELISPNSVMENNKVEKKKKQLITTNQKSTPNRINVGIPRALLFYKFHPLWTTFFEELDANVIVSPKTNKEIKTKATSCAPDEDCYSTKLYYGHVMALKDNVDYLFIPRFQSEHKSNVGCPKFVGLAESLRSAYPDLPPIIMPVYSQAKLKHGKWRLIQIAFSVGKIFTKNPCKILRATRQAFKNYMSWKQDKILTHMELSDWEQNKLFVNDPPVLHDSTEPVKIALIAHTYMLNDPYASLNIKQLLINAGVNLITSEQMPKDLIEKQMEKLDFNMYFDYERELLGTAMHFLEKKTIDGIIHIIIFSCGPDSIVGEMISRFSKRDPVIPVLQLTFDELTGETGLKTRLEAFLDMVHRKKKLEERN